MKIMTWPAKVREHRSWCEDQHTELTDWYVLGRRVPLFWYRPGVWSFGIDRYDNGVLTFSAGKLCLAVEPDEG